MDSNKENSLQKNNIVIDRFLFASDPQYWWIEGTGLTTESQAVTRLREYYAYISKYYSGVVMFINGDMTSYGHKEEWDSIHAILKETGISYIMSLGNHDYLNNRNDTLQNNAFIRSVTLQIDHIEDLKKKYKVIDWDYKRSYTPTIQVTNISGSLGYSLEFDKFLVIELHDQPNYYNDNEPHIHIADKPISYPDIAYGGTYDIILEENYAWIEKQLKWAMEHGKKVIILKHRHETSTKLQALFNQYDSNIIFKFSGHYHARLGAQDNDFILSGASCNNTFLYMQIEQYTEPSGPSMYTQISAKVYAVTLSGGQGQPLTETRNFVKSVLLYTSGN